MTTYAITHKDTGSILSYCMLGDQKVTDTASATLLRDRLIKDNLVLSLSTTSTPGFSFLKADLTVDEITFDKMTQGDFPQNPFAYVLSLPTPSSLPGDGKPKTIETGGVRTLKLHSNGKLGVTLPTGLGPTTKLVAALEGHPAVPITLNAPNSAVQIPLASGFTATAAYMVMFLGQGLQSSVGLIIAA